MPQIGHEPGASRMISGCIGHVYSIFVAGNVAVTGIAGYLLDTESHDKPPADCPLHLNRNRKLDLLTAQQRFCKACAAKLAKSHPAELKALNAILAAKD